MNVSHFELLFKAQAPASPEGGPEVETVLQGYFLEITNLEKRPYTFAVDFVMAPTMNPDRDLTGNTICFLDLPPDGDNLAGQLIGGPGDKVFQPSFGPFEIAAHGTALLAVLPDVFPMGPDMVPIPDSTFEVRGFVRIRVPPLPDGKCKTKPQGRAKVNVLLTPQNRASFFVDGTMSITEQIQASLPLGEGKAEYVLTPEPGYGIELHPPKDYLGVHAYLDHAAQDEYCCEKLAYLLGQIDPKSDVDGFNKALKAAKVGFSLKPEKV